MKKVILYFTRIPLIGQTKTRLQDFLSLSDIQKVSQFLCQKNFQEIKKVDADVMLWVNPSESAQLIGEYLPISGEMIKGQIQGNIGERMAFAIKSAADSGYGHILLLGSDLYDLNAKIIEKSFEELAHTDVVVAPTLDGGYGLIGMHELIPGAFKFEHYSHNKVFDDLVASLTENGKSVKTLDMLHDIDDKNDIAKVLSGDDSATFLAQGEYNANFIFDNGLKVLRIALGSQMRLANQIAYEYQALKGLEPSGVVPRVYELVERTDLLGKGYLVEQFVAGRHLDYQTDLDIAAEMLAKLHDVDYRNIPTLIVAEQPFKMMYEECNTMFAVYRGWQGQDQQVKERIDSMLTQLLDKGLEFKIENPCVINTELNSSNFIINPEGNSYIVDWEKPLIGEKEQDLAHFLSPTTTLFKSETWLTADQTENFIAKYNKYSSSGMINREKLHRYLLFTYMRGITWCAMAYAQYQSGAKIVTDNKMVKKVKSYLTDEFLSQIEAEFC